MQPSAGWRTPPGIACRVVPGAARARRPAWLPVWPCDSDARPAARRRSRPSTRRVPHAASRPPSAELGHAAASTDPCRPSSRLSHPQRRASVRAALAHGVLPSKLPPCSHRLCLQRSRSARRQHRGPAVLSIPPRHRTRCPPPRRVPGAPAAASLGGCTSDTISGTDRRCHASCVRGSSSSSSSSNKKQQHLSPVACRPSPVARRPSPTHSLATAVEPARLTFRASAPASARRTGAGVASCIRNTRAPTRLPAGCAPPVRRRSMPPPPSPVSRLGPATSEAASQPAGRASQSRTLLAAARRRNPAARRRKPTAQPAAPTAPHAATYSSLTRPRSSSDEP